MIVEGSWFLWVLRGDVVVVNEGSEFYAECSVTDGDQFQVEVDEFMGVVDNEF